jgi:class III poly(R)-hydroxyalkanoic acid synthase PhaC subunit
MATTISHSDRPNKNIFSFYADLFIDTSKTLARVSTSYAHLSIILSNAFAQSYPIYLNTISEYNKSWKDLSELDKILRSRFRKAFDEKFREEVFINTLSDVITSYSELAKITGLGQMYRDFSNGSSIWNNKFIEPIRDTLYRTPSEKICEIEEYSLFHYNRPPTTSTDTTSTDRTAEKEDASINQRTATTPVLVIYAFINRHYILDLLPGVSVIRSLLNQGLDIFAADWGTPSAYDRNLTIGHFVNSYLDKSVDFIRKITKSEKVSLFGYCWGGDLALMYASIHPEKVKNLVTVATPGDFDRDNSLLAIWTKTMKEDLLLDTFGNLPGILLNAAFILRNPIEYSHKYFHFFEQPRSLESVAEFFATETWLNDSPPIIGEIYREFAEYCYKQNLLIKNKMRSGERYKGNINSDTVIDLRNINIPFLNIVAKKDDLVAPSSSKALNDALTESYDKSIIELNSGHVGLMIGKDAHKKLWPKVGEWLKKRS